jgi:transmembrane sensor
MYQKYASYQLADFVTDEEFIEWVRRPTPHADAYWKEFLEIFPHQSTTIHKARRAVRLLVQESGVTNGAEEDAREIWAGIEQSLDSSRGRVRSLFSALGPARWAAAVAILLLAGAGWWISTRNQTDQATNYQVMVKQAQIANPLTEIVNTGSAARTIHLPDGSTIRLEPKSRVSYSENFAGNVREVYLTGAAFFEVTKNPEKPFLVYSNELVTKVLGTSFRIQAFDKEKNIVVSVRTGRVSVYAHKSGRSSDPETTGLLLTPNQEVQFSRAEERFSRTLVEKPAVLLSQEELQQFAFEDAPVNHIFEALEKAYGVDIVFDEEVLATCHLTTSLSAETLFDKLEVICEAIGATYKVVDAQVVISSKGCSKVSI